MKHGREVSIQKLIDKINQGYQILVMFKGSLRPFTFQNLLAGAVGVGVGMAGLCWSVRDGYLKVQLASEQKESSFELKTVAGLQNLGNNCFLNSVLQSLASCSCYLPFLQTLLVMDDVGNEQKVDTMPLVISLTSLLEDMLLAQPYLYGNLIKASSLCGIPSIFSGFHAPSSAELCLVRDEMAVLNPRRVMLAMGLYLQDFNLRRQQDAAETFIHLLSCLEKEVAEHYICFKYGGSLADISALSSRIYNLEKGAQNEFEKWQKYFTGPFDGIIGSYLTCQTCSSMLSADLEFFRSLSLPPVLDRHSDIMEGCSLSDCLKHFTNVEHVDNYRCGRCWHSAALKYLSCRTEKDEVKIRTLRDCVKFDTCDCKNLFCHEEISWTGISLVLKKLSILRCPKIFCFHLQRASVNWHGDLEKLQEHISFPLFLDLSSFVETATLMGQLTSIKYMHNDVTVDDVSSAPQISHLLKKKKMQMLPHLYRNLSHKPFVVSLSENKFGMEAISGNNSVKAAVTAMADDSHQAYSIPEIGCCKQVETSWPISSKSSMYHLCSVVEHYGGPGSGHYAVYRKVASKLSSGATATDSMNRSWVYISDSKVKCVSEEDVLDAEASMLFYEKIVADQ